MTDLANLAEALAAFQADMPTVAKSKTATVPTKNGGSYRYTYAGLADVIEAAAPVMDRHGLAFSTAPRLTDAGGYELRGVLLHKSGETSDGALPIRGNSPQELGSAITYARRYLFGCLTGVVTDDDDDGQIAEEAAKRSQRKARQPQEAPQEATGGTRRMSRSPGGSEAITQAQLGALHTAFNAAGVEDRQVRLDYCRNLIGRDLASSKDLTKAEASKVLDALKTDALEPPPEGVES